MRFFLKAGFLCLAVSRFIMVPCFAQEVTVEPVIEFSKSAYMALQSHPKIFISRSDIGVSKQQLTKVESAFLPNISLSLGIGREDSNNTSSRAVNGSGSSEMERRESAITISQMLFDGFNADNLRRSQQEVITAEELAFQNLASEVALKAIEVHLNVAAKNIVFKDHLVNLKVHEKIAKDIGLRVRSGKDDRARVSQISARLSLALANLETAKNQVFSANADYLREVGELPGNKLNFQGELFKMPESESELVDTVLGSNPFLYSKLKEMDAKQFEEKASASYNLPSLYLESGASWNANLDAVRGRNSDAFVMLRMRYDLFKGGADRASERIVKYQTQILRYELDDLRRELKREASQAWFSYQSNAKRASFLQDYVESAQTTKKAYVQQFNIGQRSLIDLLDAENELLNAKGQLQESKQDLSLSKYQIMHLQGKLLSVLNLDLVMAATNEK
ncbi:MAG: adhesin transport system outer membrane protein [Oleiphilaceae bacterium]|jgi:adhesin transport system outer membrane protein